ncbi:putative transcription factor MYB-HB-like family [Rosa chinensis]|uniref:Putative transcription factor MYB-HB-like family n=2 Tax=Rosa TaxID=3764 RepID=A0A2P6PDE3_ROSCH|nr:putative transcription factor MYB-HB-like family [Rosa chinensis]
MLRDNICWEAISETLGTRTNAVCSMKWYNQLTSPLVSQKLWADIDDYRLLDALNSLDACCIEDVDWDDLLEHRPGDVCQKRWHQMVKHIGHHGLKSFPEQVEVLSKRYLADLIEAREIYASKPAVD